MITSWQRLWNSRWIDAYRENSIIQHICPSILGGLSFRFTSDSPWMFMSANKRESVDFWSRYPPSLGTHYLHLQRESTSGIFFRTCSVTFESIGSETSSVAKQQFIRCFNDRHFLLALKRSSDTNHQIFLRFLEHLTRWNSAFFFLLLSLKTYQSIDLR